MTGIGIVNTALLPIYAELDIRRIRTDELLYGTKVTITETKERDRYRIETDYHYTGFVSSKGLCLTRETANKWDNGNTVTVLHRFCDVMSQPTVRSSVLLTLYRGSVLLDIGQAAQPGWHCVRLVDGTEGYVREEYVSKTKRVQNNPLVWKEDKEALEQFGDVKKQADMKGLLDAFCACAEQKKGSRGTEAVKREQLVNTAYSYLGTPYRWGGKSTIGIDCSGFCFMVYALNGIYIHRDSAWLSTSVVHKIPDCERNPGDLLYFPGHIALYLGNGEYIHSTARDGAGVTINTLRKGFPGYRADLERSYLFAGSVFSGF